MTAAFYELPEQLASISKPIQQTTELVASMLLSHMFPVLQQFLKYSLKANEEYSSVMKSIKESIAQDLNTS